MGSCSFPTVRFSRKFRCPNCASNCLFRKFLEPYHYLRFDRSIQAHERKERIKIYNIIFGLISLTGNSILHEDFMRRRSSIFGHLYRCTRLDIRKYLWKHSVKPMRRELKATETLLVRRLPAPNSSVSHNMLVSWIVYSHGSLGAARRLAHV